MRKLILIFVLLVIAIPAWAVNPFDNGRIGVFTHTTGGDDSALDSISSPPNNKIAYVIGTIDGFGCWSFYVFDIDSTATESGQTNIEPGSGTGRWIQKQPFFIFGTAAELEDVSDQAGVIKWVIE